MFPLVMIAMQLLAKKKEQEAQRKAEQERLANERAAESGGDTKVAHANAFTRSQGQQNFGNAQSLYGAFAGENSGVPAGGERPEWGDDQNSVEDQRKLRRYGM